MLAASNGHIDCLRYILVQAQKHLKPAEMKSFVSASDAFGGTALADAVRENHVDCVKELEKDRWNSDLSDRVLNHVDSVENSPREVALGGLNLASNDELMQKFLATHTKEMNALKAQMQKDKQEI